MATKPDLDALRGMLRDRGLRATPSRIAVLQHLLSNIGEPLSHGEVTERLSSGPWDAATIYRNLTDLVEAGLARRTEVGDRVWRFEATTEDHDGATHPHFVCTECGTVECMPELKFVLPRARTPRAVKQREVEVQMRGLCDTCS